MNRFFVVGHSPLVTESREGAHLHFYLAKMKQSTLLMTPNWWLSSRTLTFFVDCTNRYLLERSLALEIVRLNETLKIVQNEGITICFLFSPSLLSVNCSPQGCESLDNLVAFLQNWKIWSCPDFRKNLFEFQINEIRQFDSEISRMELAVKLSN